MKNVYLLIACIVCLTGLYFGLNAYFGVAEIVPTPIESPIPEPIGASEDMRSTSYIEIGGRRIAYDVIRTTAERVRLILNLPVATDSASALSAYECSSLTSAGFYTKGNTPLGLFITGSRTESRRIESSLVDGFVWAEADQKIRIGQEFSEDTPVFALQSGPVVRVQGAVRPLRLRSDEFARRIVAAVTQSGVLYLIVLYDSEATFSGPLLSQVPDSIEAIDAQQSLAISDAINLDGGSASVFITPNIALREIQPAGGFFCIN